MNAPKTNISRRFPQLPARFAGVVMPFLLSVLMTAVVSLISTLRAAGFGDGTPALWLNAWAVSWVVAFPTLLLALPMVRRLTAVLVAVR